MLKELERIDRALFTKLNGEWTNPFFDFLMPWLRHSSTWTPLYLFLFFFMLYNFKQKSWWWIIFFLCTVALTDMTGTQVFKHNFERLRPCKDPEMVNHLRLLLKHCSGSSSFTSNHAANHFGMATFFFMTFRKLLPKIAWIGFIWAAAISYAQVYVGVHYPADVLCGALLGVLMGVFTSSLYNRRYGLSLPDKASTN
jgi:membrane-associated phospholipid phosphatase